MPKKVTPTLEKILYLLLILGAGISRFWNLDTRTMHYDESLHALYSWNLFKGLGYHHQPWLHGPFQFYATCLTYWLFGVTNYTVRVLPAIFGTILVGLPYFLRNYLGRLGGLLAALLLTLSPSILYYSRFARNEIYLLVWTMLLFILLCRYWNKPKNAHLYLASAVLAIIFCTKEIGYIIVFIFGSFMLIKGIEEFRYNKQKSNSPSRFAYRESFLLLVTLTLPLWIGFIKIPLQWLNINSPGWPFEGIQPNNIPWITTWIILIFILSSIIGIFWNWKVWFLSSVIFWSIFVTFYSSFFQNISAGLISGIWGSAAYWLEVHEQNRIYEPPYYYLVILLIYEFLPFFSAACGCIYYAKRKAKPGFLIYWLIISLLLYSIIGEKPPWLVVHITLPCILLAGKFWGEFFLKNEGPGKLLKSVTAVILAVFLLFTGFISFNTSYRNIESPEEMFVYCQGSQEINKIVMEIDNFAQTAKQGKNLMVSIDQTLTGGAIFSWYLKNQTIEIIPDGRSMGKEPAGSILIIAERNEESARPFLHKYDSGKKFKFVIWFPAFSRNSVKQTWKNLTTAQTWKNGWRYFIYRISWSVYHVSNGIIYFPKDYH